MCADEINFQEGLSQLGFIDRIMPGYIKELEQLAQQHREALARIKQLETELADAKSKRYELERVTIPDSMFELGLDSVQLSSGGTIKVQFKYEARLAKNQAGEIDKERTELFYQWLQKNGFAGLVQSVFAVYTRDPAVVMFLKQACEVNGIGYEYTNKDIHWKTLESWFKEQSEAGTELPLELFQNWTGRIAVVK